MPEQLAQALLEAAADARTESALRIGDNPAYGHALLQGVEIGKHDYLGPLTFTHPAGAPGSTA